MYYVYILLLNNKNFYTGVTNDLKRRSGEHARGNVPSTTHKRPLKLIHYEAYLLKEDAARREKFLKTTYGKRELRRQLSSLLKMLRLK